MNGLRAAEICSLVFFLIYHSHAAEVRICEGASRSLQCSAGDVLKINSAAFGRTRRTVCITFKKPFFTSTCYSKPSTLSTVKRLCEGHPFCNLLASTKLFTDPCPYYSKYLTVSYECMKNTAGQARVTQICDKMSQVLSCSNGGNLEILASFYGRQETSVCAAGGGSTSDTSCKLDTTSKVSAACDDKKICVLQADKKVYGDPCVLTNKYLQVTYRCVGTGHSIHMCEWEKRTISCPAGKVLKIKSPFWGRSDTTTCLVDTAPAKSTTCLSSTIEKTINSLCSGKRSCEIHAHYQKLGDPCPGNSKYFSALYECDGPPPTTALPVSRKSVMICEWDKQTLSCPSNKHVVVVSAFYGRDDFTTCLNTNAPAKSNKCSDNNILSTVKSKCDGKLSCDIEVHYLKLGDPCSGNSKFFRATYDCVTTNPTTSKPITTVSQSI